MQSNHVARRGIHVPDLERQGVITVSEHAFGDKPRKARQHRNDAVNETLARRDSDALCGREV